MADIKVELLDHMGSDLDVVNAARVSMSKQSEWIWSGSLYAFARVVNQRMDSHAQRECAEVAKPISDACADLFPVSWAALVSH